MGHSRDKEEVVICAAVKKDGVIFAGARHCDPVMRTQLGAEGVDDWIGGEQGFITNKFCHESDCYRFVDRETAMVIARAAGQVSDSHTSPNSDILFSEDLY